MNGVKTWLINNFIILCYPSRPLQDVQFYDKEILILCKIFPHIINADTLCTVYLHFLEIIYVLLLN